MAVTAAHCITGRGSGYVFAPGYRNGRTPFGVWHVVRVYGSPRWIHAGGRHWGTQRDWAFLVLARQTRNGRRVGVQEVTGGNRLGLVARDGTVVHVPGYGVGAADTAVTCRARVYHHHGYPAFDCGGYVGGTSGSPWLLRRHHRRIVVGVIGGLHQGGCTPSTSYSSRLGRPARLAFRRAERGRPGDRFPSPPSDGC